MGGRGGSSGAKAVGASKPQYFKESEKAVQLKLSVEDVDLDQKRTRTVWVPKSQLADDGRPSEWITEQKSQEFYPVKRPLSQYQTTWEDANGLKFGASKTQKEKEAAERKSQQRQKSIDRYDNLVSVAKAAGVKGVRSGMKAATIIQKINKSGINYSYEDYLKGKKFN